MNKFLEDVYTGNDIASVKEYFIEAIEKKYGIVDLTIPCGDRTEAEVFGLTPFKHLIITEDQKFILQT